MEEAMKRIETTTSSIIDIVNDEIEVIVSNCEKSENCEAVEDAEDNSIHGFNVSNVTVIEKTNERTDCDSSLKFCEGSDSGVEIGSDFTKLKRTLSNNSSNYQEFDNVRSCDSSIISCCSNYEEAYNILARRNSTLMEDFNLRNGDGTSENGSESSSLSRSSSKGSKRNKNNITNSKKTPDFKCQQPIRNARNQKSNNNRTTPNSRLSISSTCSLRSNKPTLHSKLLQSSSSFKKDTKSSVRNVAPTAAIAKTPTSTPTDDGRWPSINSKPAPSMGNKTLKVENFKGRLLTDSSSIYATFPRRRKEKDPKDVPYNRSNSKENNGSKSVRRDTTPFRILPPFPKKKSSSSSKTKIYHETSVQTALTNEDVEKALAGVCFKRSEPHDKEFKDDFVQADIGDPERKKLQERIEQLNVNYEKLKKDYEKQEQLLRDTERRLKEEKTEKEGLEEELKHNTDRVLAIIGTSGLNQPNGKNVSSDSLIVLESRYKNVSDIVIKQEQEISELNSLCRNLQRELDKAIHVQNTLIQNLHEQDSETKELQEFLQVEKNTLSDALKESEVEIKKLNAIIKDKDKEVESKREECRQLTRLSEHRRLENADLQSRLSALELNYKDVLVHGNKISSAAIALSLLISRLDCLNQELIKSYNISEQELEDVIFHNEAYTNSPDLTPENKQSSFDQESSMTGSFIINNKGSSSSFVSAIINAIKNAAAQSFMYYKELGNEPLHSEVQNTSEILDLETEPCLMMEPVLEDVVLPDTHSQNLVSSISLANSIRLTRSESLTNLSNSFTHRQLNQQLSLDNAESMNASLISNSSSYSDFGSSITILDQIIHLDNLVTKLLKILRIIQMENEEIQSELQEEKDNLLLQVDKQKEGNKIVAKQLTDWESLGSKLKLEVNELKQELSKKNCEIQSMKVENDKSKKEIEELNEDVCTLSTLCSKCENQNDQTNPETNVKNHQTELLQELSILQEQLLEKEKWVKEIMDECRASKEIQTENFKLAIEGAKKQYKAISNSLQILHSIQPVVKEYPQLAKLQSDLEDLNFQAVSSTPVVSVPNDFNTNKNLVKTVPDLEIPSPINSTA